MKIRNTLLAAVAAAAMAAVLAGCSSGGSAPSPTQTGQQGGVTTIKLDREIPHIHGAGYDAASGLVYAGTHEGVFQVTSAGAVAEVGTSRDDLMGFSIAGADNWYSSGHPGAGSSAANPLGLIHSGDKGRVWHQISLAGQVDFHALAAAGARVVGVDASGTIITSANGGATWTAGASMPARAMVFAGDSLLAASPQGLARSTDSGMSFASIPSAPAAALLSAGAAGGVWCVDTAGVAWSSADGGSTWTRRASVGAVNALAAVDANTAYALTPSSLLRIG